MENYGDLQPIARSMKHILCVPTENLSFGLLPKYQKFIVNPVAVAMVHGENRTLLIYRQVQMVIITHLVSQTSIWHSCKWNFDESKVSILRFRRKIFFGIKSFVDETCV